ncbi:hypothetical protein SDC9_88474 [bioreactor metagenome]|uniref:Uncharacterized protein n=1 Tax=bioreactor metagenome TaxID=1076179 RepID=A0A644ZW74_9ZZZZ
MKPSEVKGPGVKSSEVKGPGGGALRKRRTQKAKSSGSEAGVDVVVVGVVGEECRAGQRVRSTDVVGAGLRRIAHVGGHQRLRSRPGDHGLPVDPPGVEGPPPRMVTEPAGAEHVGGVAGADHAHPDPVGPGEPQHRLEHRVVHLPRGDVGRRGGRKVDPLRGQHLVGERRGGDRRTGVGRVDLGDPPARRGLDQTYVVRRPTGGDRTRGVTGPGPGHHEHARGAGEDAAVLCLDHLQHRRLGVRDDRAGGRDQALVLTEGTEPGPGCGRPGLTRPPGAQGLDEAGRGELDLGTYVARVRRPGGSRGQRGHGGAQRGGADRAGWAGRWCRTGGPGTAGGSGTAGRARAGAGGQQHAGAGQQQGPAPDVWRVSGHPDSVRRRS